MTESNDNLLSDKTRIWVGSQSLETTPLPQSWRQGTNGAVIEFRGCVRNINEGREVCGIDYDAHLPLARKALEEIRNEILEASPQLGDVLIFHRTGRLSLGETSLLVGVASPHRKEAFRACEDIIIEIKKRVPVWKRELYADESEAWLKGYSLRGPIDG